MRFWMIFWLLIAVLVGVFAIANWGELSEQTNLNLIVARVSAPLGLVMLGAMAVLSLLYLVFLVWLETKALVQFGRRGSAAEQGTAALGDLRHELEQQLSDFRGETADSFRTMIARLEHLERTVKDEVGRAG